jgi:hypothetical protein
MNVQRGARGGQGPPRGGRGRGRGGGGPGGAAGPPGRPPPVVEAAYNQSLITLRTLQDGGVQGYSKPSAMYLL